MDTPRRWWWWRIPVVFACLCCLNGLLDASAGDEDPIYRSCVEKCETSGCVGDNCFQLCNFSSDGKPIDGPWYLQEPLYRKWKQWDCLGDCLYHCMLTREKERQKLGDHPVKYHGKWPFFRVYGWNTKVCFTMALTQLLIWASWASITYHPSRWKLRAVVIGRLLSMLLKVYDFPPYLGYIDAHALWHATTFPLTYLWWSFIRDDAEFRTSLLVKKVK